MLFFIFSFKKETTMESKKLVKKTVGKKKVVAHKSNHSKWPNAINNAEHLNQAVVCFLHDNEKWIHKYADQVNPKDSAVEQLASLIVGLITNKLLVEGKHSLDSIMKAGFALAKKNAEKKPAAKKAVAKKPAAKKAVAKKPAAKKAVAKKAVAKKAVAKKVVAKKPMVKKAVAKKVAVKKPIVKKAVAKKVVAKKPMVKKAVAKKVAVKKPMVKKPEAKKITIKKPMAKKPMAKKAS
jgi:hypothetical protein